MVCSDVEKEPGLQPVTGEDLNRGENQAPDARLNKLVRGFYSNDKNKKTKAIFCT